MQVNSANTYNPHFEAYRLGVTGNIASGKSTVQKYFENKGIKCIDVDDVCHKLYESDNSVIEKVKSMFNNFGFHDLDNDTFIDRKKIRTLVFKSPEIKKALEDIVHPAVEEYVDNFVKANEEEKYVAIFNPLLFETGKQNKYDRILFIKIGPQLQLKRLLERNPFLTEETAKERINSQMSQRIKEKKADFVIDNSFGREYTIDQFETLADKLEYNSTWLYDESFIERLEAYFQGYPERIKYTWRHKKAYLDTEKLLTGKNTFRGYLHDLDKLIMYIIGVPKETAHNIHISMAPHHIRNGKVRYPKGAVIDWECARFTKPDKPFNARTFYECACPEIPEIKHVLDELKL